MGLDGFSSVKWPALVRHKISKRFPHSPNPEGCSLAQSTKAAHQEKLDVEHLSGCTRSNSKHFLSSAGPHNSSSEEVLQLEKILHDNVSAGCAMEMELANSVPSLVTNDTVIPKSTSELIKEIAVLELEVLHLEHYLLSLYRRALDPQSKKHGVKSPLANSRRRLDFSRSDMPSRKEKIAPQTDTYLNSCKQTDDQMFVHSGVQRSHSSLSQRSTLANRASPPADDALGKEVRACHSQPTSMMEYAQKTSSNVTSLAEHLGACITDHIQLTPNKLSEEMVKCMSNIYYKLADPPLALHHGFSSPASSFSSMSGFSPDLWSPEYRNDLSFDVRVENPFSMEGIADFSGPYGTMIEVQCLYRDQRKMRRVEYLLQDFRSLICRLEEIDPGKMSNEEKLAFWINVHNALVMHAFLAYGTPQNNVKRMLVLLKAAYNVGGKIVSVDAIQNAILGCRMPRPAQWLRLLIPSRKKFKANDERQAYAIERPEPLLHFALSSGSFSDPAVRSYSPKRVFQELEAAREEYIRATFVVQKDSISKMALPKVVEYFAKDSGLCTAGILEMIQQSLPLSLRKRIKKKAQVLESSRKNIEWIQHNFSFRYLISRDLVK